MKMSRSSRRFFLSALWLAATVVVGAGFPQAAYAEDPVVHALTIKAEIAGKVIEFYHSDLDHYFITANPAEAAAIDSGSAGPGWKRTGLDFSSGGVTSVCRFYGSVSPGPNSHFYTADASECQALKDIQARTPATEKRWNFEGHDFTIETAVNGSCVSGQRPVFRAYNNGAARGVDSNHRISADVAAIEEVLGRGWLFEGVVMCSP